MKSYLALSWKEVKAQRVTAILILIAVVMSAAMTTVIGQAVGILQSMRVAQAEGLNGSRYASFHRLTAEQAEMLHADSRLCDVGDLLNVGSMPLANSSLTLYLREYQGNAIAMYPSVGKVREGRLPERENEIALPEDALNYLGMDVSVGDTVSLTLSASVADGSVLPYGYSADFILTGVLESNYLGYSTGIVDGIVGGGTTERLLPDEYVLYSTDFKTCSKTEFQEIVDDLADTLNLDDSQIQYNWILLDALGISYGGEGGSDVGSGFPFMAFACVLVGVLVLSAAGLVIYNILRISVTRRIKEYGTLRAMGGERGQIYRLVSAQLLILCGVGMPIGLLLGVLSAKGVLIAAAGIFNPDLFMVGSTDELNAAIHSTDAGSPAYLLLSVAVTLIFAMLAAFPAARYAARVSPTVAMAAQAAKIRRKVRKMRSIRNFEAYYARLNLKRSRARTAITILSLVMSITVFVTLQSFTGLLDASAALRDSHTGDYAVTNETIGMSEDAVDALRSNDLVESLATTKLSVYSYGDERPFDTDLVLQTYEALHIASLDEARLFSGAADLTEQDRADLAAGAACLVKNPIEFSIGGTEVQFTELRPGDTVSFGAISMRVAGIVDFPVEVNHSGFVNGVQVIVADHVYNEIVDDSRYSEVYPTLREGADEELFENWLDGWCNDNPGTHWLSYRMSDAQAAESFERIRILCWAFIVFVGVIGILNIINTVYSNIHTRVPEIGMQRAIGMSAGSLYRTFLWEGAYYGIAASVVGGALGYVCTVFVGAADTGSLRLSAIPIMSIGEAAFTSVAACLLATAIPLRSIARRGIVESIETVE